MGLADRLTEAPQRTTGKPCSVGALEDYLTGAEADALHTMLYSLGWSGTKIYLTVQDEAKKFRAAGDIERAAMYSQMAEQTVNRHRSSACRCFKDAA